MSIIYPLHATGENKTYLHPVSSYVTEEACRSQHDLWLRDDLEKDNCTGELYHRYRLCAKEPHSIEMALSYDIQCPKCGGRLKQIGRNLNCCELGLYACPACDRKRR